jgi:hypothetical protein
MKYLKYYADYRVNKIEFKVVYIRFDRTAASPYFKKLTIATLSSLSGFGIDIDIYPKRSSEKW